MARRQEFVNGNSVEVGISEALLGKGYHPPPPGSAPPSPYNSHVPP